ARYTWAAAAAAHQQFYQSVLDRSRLGRATARP
ncbi:MAG: hypothetical protein JWL68_6201, partial [Actinomycetia bacterium]|nr:hypothetical protein [Actinomycetes bacterium]